MTAAKSLLDDVGAVFGFCKERIAGKGEDSCCYRFHEQGGVIAVFDGCGGSGAESYSKLGNHSGAYLASRAAAAATMKWFEEQDARLVLDEAGLDGRIAGVLGACDRYAEQPQSKIRGSITKTFPTTMAALVLQRAPDQATIATAVSAGDSHLYLLDAEGLKQLNEDDVADGDAFTNLYDDPPMTNVVSLGSSFKLKWRTYGVSEKCVLLAATDGCFGYLKSPMEFELLLLDALMAARSIDEWQGGLETAIDAVAGDDQTLMAVVYGYRSFDELKRALAPRFDELAGLLAGVEAAEDGFGERSRIWSSYRRGYYSLLATMDETHERDN